MGVLFRAFEWMWKEFISLRQMEVIEGREHIESCKGDVDQPPDCFCVERAF